jgi:hypothetical protein
MALSRKPTFQAQSNQDAIDHPEIIGGKGISRQISLAALSVAKFRVAEHLDTIARGGGSSVLFREIAPHDSGLVCRSLPSSSQNIASAMSGRFDVGKSNRAATR